MYRRTVLGLLGTAALALAGLGGPGARADDKDAHKGHLHGPFATCAKACAECSMQCESCARHCALLLVEGKKQHARTMATCTDCGDVCAVAMRVVSRGGPMSATICEACAKSCDVCAAACEKHPSDEHMAACAKACRDCAKACREMIKHAGHHS